MIEIYKYNPSSTWFKNVVNDSTLKGKNRDTAIENAIKEHGVQISIAEYFKDWNRNSCCKDYCYACYNGAENSIERIVNAEINYDKDLTYLNAKNNNPEDLIESRTSWDEMKGYADGLYWFINSIISDVVKDKIITPQVANEVEPKFKVGDWIANDYCVGKIIALTDDAYLLDSGQGIPFSCEHNAHRWTIEDAKDGDVLHSTGFHNDCIFIFNGLDNWKFDEPNGDRAVATGYCCLSISADKMEFGMQGPDCVEVNTVKPATKIQCDLLFRKIKEAGYEWDAEKKELKEIEHTCELDNSYACVKFPFKAKVKSSGKIVTIHGGQLSQDCKEWIKYQSDAEDGYKVYEPNDLELVCKIDCNSDWSEDDENTIKFLISHFCTCHPTKTFQFTINEVITHDELLRKIRHLKHQNTWKPSDEQMDTLEYYMHTLICNEHKEVLFGLYADLKKLKE